MPSLKAIYRAEAADIALTRLEEFEAEWGKRYLAPGLGPRRAVLRLRPRDQKNDLHYELHRSLEPFICARSSRPVAVSRMMKRLRP
jgi:hypothetical protein